ncbi:hypothetical protein BT63DRAFT_414342 [Microthyrium microscopicum]|uniref:MARVEL domain-containing protein n=1 Tax=Microthyrium microscopicum TaxID=703497 RepID=A0A6A6UB52_9PEZI|nr:hypothetical protein BT63DRAFT_414342 [Microthyrium microscopicum]
MREVPFPTPVTPAIARDATALFRTEGPRPRFAKSEEEQALRDEFMDRYFSEAQLNELPDIMAQRDVVEPGMWRRRWKRHILSNPLVPLLLRILILSFILGALSLAVNLHRTASTSTCTRGPDITYLVTIPTLTAFLLLIIAVDEVRAPPIGLRKRMTKFMLTLIDVLFNLLLAAATAIGWSMYIGAHCADEGANAKMHRLARALSSLLTVCSVLWTGMFGITIARLLAHTMGVPGGGSNPVTMRRRGTVRSRRMSVRW